MVASHIKGALVRELTLCDMGKPHVTSEGSENRARLPRGRKGFFLRTAAAPGQASSPGTPRVSPACQPRASREPGLRKRPSSLCVDTRASPMPGPRRCAPSSASRCACVCVCSCVLWLCDARVIFVLLALFLLTTLTVSENSGAVRTLHTSDACLYSLSVRCSVASRATVASSHQEATIPAPGEQAAVSEAIFLFCSRVSCTLSGLLCPGIQARRSRCFWNLPLSEIGGGTEQVWAVTDAAVHAHCSEARPGGREGITAPRDRAVGVRDGEPWGQSVCPRMRTHSRA